jgi:hypothetical protein
MRLRRTPTRQLLFVCIGSGLIAACSAGGSAPRPTSKETGGTAGSNGGLDATGNSSVTGTTSGTGMGTGVPPIIGGGGAGGKGGAGGADLGDAACVAEPRRGEQKPVDLYIMLDKSGSMTCPVGIGLPPCLEAPTAPPPTRWSSTVQALNTFVNSPDNKGIGVGLDFFPEVLNSSDPSQIRCTPAEYEPPTVPITVLPGAAPAISAAIAAITPNGGTPTTPALTGALNYARTYAAAHIDHVVAVVFATDGAPTYCNNNNIASAAAAAAAAASATPPVKTYVLGVGPNLSNLNQIAQAGGTTQALLVESGGAADLIAALNSIRKSTLTCDYNIPTLDGGMLDYTRVNVKTRVGTTGSLVDVLNVPNAAACGTGDGWYYDTAVPPAMPPPTRITLCPTTCAPLLTTPDSAMDVYIGCKTVPRIVQ